MGGFYGAEKGGTGGTGGTKGKESGTTSVWTPESWSVADNKTRRAGVCDPGTMLSVVRSPRAGYRIKGPRDACLFASSE